jgi:divalent metal cation (Fe/Co/Zn/Cd) transporter
MKELTAYCRKSFKQNRFGIWIIAATAIINYLLGYISIKKGKRKFYGSYFIRKTLQSDTINNTWCCVSLIVVYFTKIYWLDSVVALFLEYIIVVGYKIVRKSLSGIMDEQDPDF